MSTATSERVLIVEDDAALADLEVRRLRRAGLHAESVPDLAQAQARLAAGACSLVVVDYQLPDGHAGQLLDWLRAEGRDLPVVVVTGRGDEHLAVEMMKWGARDYLVKGSQTLEVLPEVVGRVLAQAQLQRELRAAQERYQFIVDHTDDVISIHDPAGRALFVSPAAERLTGLPLGTLHGDGWMACVHPADAPELHSLMQRLQAGQLASAAVEYRLRNRQGEWLWIETVARLTDTGSGAQIICASRDVTARKLAEAHRRAHTALLEALAAISQQDPEAGNLAAELGTLLARLAEIVGVDSAVIHLAEGDRLVPRAFYDSAGHDLSAWTVAPGEGLVGPVAAGGRPRELHGRALQRLDSPWLRGSAFRSVLSVPLRGRSGVLGVLTLGACSPRQFSAADRQLLQVAAERCAFFLENARLRARLAASEARYRELVESLPDILAELDSEGHITYVNSALTRVLGASPEGLIGRPCLSLFAEAERERLAAHLEAAFRDGQPFMAEAAAEGGDGQTVQLSVRGFVKRDHDGRVTGMVVVVHDVTQRRRLEERLRQSQRLEAIGRLAGGIAHDFNNLLTGILGSAQILEEQLAAEHPFREDLDLIVTGAQKAAGLTRQLLAFGRRQTMELAPVNVGAVVREMVKLIGRTIGEDIEMVVRVVDDLPFCLADAGQLEQVVLNLCVNARDAMPHGGRLIIAVDAAEVTPDMLEATPWARPGQYVRLSVTDTGTGMDAQTVTRIFEPYFSTKAASGRGAGLGLATVHGIVTQHGGLIHVYSEPDLGSEFKVYLPVADSAAPQPPAAEAGGDPAPGRGATVLVAEDEGPIRRVIERALTAAGYRVVLAEDGQEAVRRFSAQPDAFDLVMLDAVMPGVDGREAMAVIRRQRPGVPILFISGFAEEVLGEALAGEAFLPKPFTREQLLRRVHAALQSGQRAGSSDNLTEG